SPSEPIGDGLVFVADPLDGTTNFLHGFPWYAVSIGAMDQGALVAGVILNAANGELFTATAGGGARLNGQPIHVSSIADPGRALIGTGFPFKDPQHIDEYLRMLPPMMRDIAGLRRPGSAALDLADVACGRFEAFFELSLSPWDIAAGVLIAREAGGIVTDRTGAPCQVARTSVVAGNPAMHSWLLEIVRGNTGVDANPSPCRTAAPPGRSSSSEDALTRQSIYQWFAPPQLERPDLRERARALWILSWPFFAIIAVVLGIGVLVEPYTAARRATTIGAVGTLMAVLHAISRAGRPVFASWTLVTGLSVIVTQRAWVTGGIHAPVAAFYVLFIIMAGVLLGTRGGLATAALCTLGAIALTVGTALEWLAPRPGAG